MSEQEKMDEMLREAMGALPTPICRRILISE